MIHAEPITPIPQTIEYDKAKAKLGHKLFFEPRLSKDGTIACVNCHILPGSGADPNPVSFGVGGAKGIFNSPTVLNAVFNLSQFWDGRARDLKEQAKGPISNPIEMALPMEAAIETLKADEAYVKAFAKIYADGITPDNVVDAIAEFERALITPNARFDRYLRKEEGVLNEQELRGWELFQKRGCISCHNGINVGGNLYQKSGIFAQGKMEIHDEHFGRFFVTKKEKDKYYFKVPTLRNISLTAPYFHDGSTYSLKEAVEKMMEFQLGIIPDPEEVDDITAFLMTLEGETPAILHGVSP
jgi:cytochrome c peroxidase